MLAFVGLQDLIVGNGWRRALRLAVLPLGALLAPFVTPFGIDTWRMVLHAVFNPVLRINIVDWNPLRYAMAQQWHAGHSGVIYYVLVPGFIAVFAITFALKPRGGDLPFVVIGAMMSLAAWTAVRNMPLAVIACAMPIARHTTLLLADLRTRAEARGTHTQPPTRALCYKSMVRGSSRNSVRAWGTAFLTAVAPGGAVPIRGCRVYAASPIAWQHPQ